MSRKANPVRGLFERPKGSDVWFLQEPKESTEIPIR
jgi:hypothetical protein